MFRKVKPENLATYVRKIDAIFPYFQNDVEVQTSDIKKYYKESYWGYALFHSWSGAIHMALSDADSFSKNDYFRQAEEIERILEGLKPGGNGAKVLEVGCGRGFNLAYLAHRFPNAQFLGIDISEEHIASAKRRLALFPNAAAQIGDFQSLGDLQANAFDVVFAVETLCHATRMESALKAIARVLTPMGKLVVYDGFRSDKMPESDLIQTAVAYSEKAMAVPEFRTVPAFVKVAAKSGLQVLSEEDLSTQIMPNLIRLSDLAKAFFKVPSLSRIISRMLPRGLVTNSIAGILMAVTVQVGAHRYMKLVLSKAK